MARSKPPIDAPIDGIVLCIGGELARVKNFQRRGIEGESQACIYKPAVLRNRNPGYAETSSSR